MAARKPTAATAFFPERGLEKCCRFSPVVYWCAWHGGGGGEVKQKVQHPRRSHWRMLLLLFSYNLGSHSWFLLFLFVSLNLCFVDCGWYHTCVVMLLLQPTPVATEGKTARNPLRFSEFSRLVLHFTSHSLFANGSQLVLFDSFIFLWFGVFRLILMILIISRKMSTRNGFFSYYYYFFISAVLVLLSFFYNFLFPKKSARTHRKHGLLPSTSKS